MLLRTSNWTAPRGRPKRDLDEAALLSPPRDLHFGDTAGRSGPLKADLKIASDQLIAQARTTSIRDPSARLCSPTSVHKQPAFVLTNQLRRTAVHLVVLHAQRVAIENGIADALDFFDMDALSLAVALKVNCNLQLTLTTSSLYRLFGEPIRNGYATAKSQHIFRNFINAASNMMITERDIRCVFRSAPTIPCSCRLDFTKLLAGDVAGNRALTASLRVPSATGDQESFMAIIAIDHVQLAMPAGQEEQAREFYRAVLGLLEKSKPADVAKREGCWFETGQVKIHLGVDKNFHPATKAHPGLLVNDLQAIMERCAEKGFKIAHDVPLEGYQRVFVSNPFGNRLELLQKA